jgi:hypothetical protein
MRLSVVIIASLVFLAPPQTGAGVGSQMVDQCTPISTGLDTTYANRSESGGLGKTLGQVFHAEHLTVSSVTVWPYAGASIAPAPMHLFITTADSSTGPPNSQDILLDGPTNPPVPNGSGLPLIFAINPMLRLPSVGYYAIIIKDEAPDCFGAFVLVADSSDGYASGGLWRLSPLANCSGPGRAPTSLEREDLIFAIGFCMEGDPAEQSTWGRIRSIYH